MMMKPKNTALNPKAMVFKRFLPVQISKSVEHSYKTTSADSSTTMYWLFDFAQQDFNAVAKEKAEEYDIVEITEGAILSYNDKQYVFNGIANEWVESKLQSLKGTISITNESTIARYQINKYYYVGALDYMIQGGIEGATVQFVKGNILPLNSLNIKYYNDNLVLSKDDIVVIGKRAFLVEDTEAVQKRMPKPYTIYFSTLNNLR